MVEDNASPPKLGNTDSWTAWKAVNKAQRENLLICSYCNQAVYPDGSHNFACPFGSARKVL